MISFVYGEDGLPRFSIDVEDNENRETYLKEVVRQLVTFSLNVSDFVTRNAEEDLKLKHDFIRELQEVRYNQESAILIRALTEQREVQSIAKMRSENETMRQVLLSK